MNSPDFSARSWAEALGKAQAMFDVGVQLHVYGVTLAEIRALPVTLDCPECELC